LKKNKEKMSSMHAPLVDSFGKNIPTKEIRGAWSSQAMFFQKN
jgi:hypothetical protein